MSALAPAVLLTPELIAELSPAARAMLPHMPDLWLRPEQRFDCAGLRELGCLAGRGWGKTFAMACVVVDHVLRLGAIRIGLMGPTEEVTRDVQIRALVDASPHWCKPALHGDQLVWPNGARARMFTAQEPGRSRGPTYHLFWFTEIVEWPARTREEAWSIAQAACRALPALLLWDSTARGTNPVLQERLRLAREEPQTHRVARGSSFANAFVALAAVRSTYQQFTGQRRQEEVYGEIFDHAAGALWGLEEIDARRVDDAPQLKIKLFAHDPAFSDAKSADEIGLVGAGLGVDGDVYILTDESGGSARDIGWAQTVVDGYEFGGYAGVVTETNRGGHSALQVLKAACQLRKITVKEIPHAEPFRARIAGQLQVKEINTKNSKTVRGEAARTFGRVHHAGTFAELEHELTTYDGTGRSPGRFDAFNYAVNELAGLNIQAKAPPPPQAGYGALVDALRGGTRRAI